MSPTPSRALRRRLGAGTLALALPLLAVAGCGVVKGVEKKESIKGELSAALAHLKTSHAESFTLHLDDSKGSLARLAAKGHSMSDAVLRALLGGSITVTTEVTGTGGLTAAGCHQGVPDVGKLIASSAVSISVSDASAELVALRVVGGTVYAHIGLSELDRLAAALGTPGLNAKLDQQFGHSPLAQGLADVRAGKWLALPLTPYLDKLKQLNTKLPTADLCRTKAQASALGSRVFAAIKPYVKVTDANNSSSNRVLDVDVHVRPALTALLAVLKTDTQLPFGQLLSGATTTAVQDALSDGSAHGTITLSSGHLRQVTVDLESLRLLDRHPGSDSLAGTSLVLDIDDSAPPVVAPTDVSTIDLGKLIGGLFGAAVHGAGASGAFGSTHRLSVTGFATAAP